MGRIIGAILGVIAIIVIVILAYTYIVHPVGHWAGNVLAARTTQQKANTTSNVTQYVCPDGTTVSDESDCTAHGAATTASTTVSSAPATSTTSTTAGAVSTSTTSTSASTNASATCSNQGVRNDNDPAVHPEGWTFDKDHAYVVHVWSNFRAQNLNPQNFPKPGESTPQHEFIMFIEYGQGATLPPGTGGSSWAFDCHAQGWADYTMEKVTEHFVDISIDQIQSYYNTGNPWGQASQPAPQAAVVASSTNAQTCSMSNAQVVNQDPTPGQTWTLSGKKAWVIHYWSNQHNPNLDPQHFSGASPDVPHEYIFVTATGNDVTLPPGSGGKAWGYDCDSSAQADYKQQISQEHFVEITWEQLQSYSRTGNLN